MKQENFSVLTEYHKKFYDVEKRTVKAKKIVTILEDFSKKSLNELNCLDLGSSTGIIGNYLAEHFGKVTGGDIDEQALKHANKQNKKKNLEFKYVDATNMPFKSQTFDIIICNRIYEHVSDYNKMMSEIYRVLKDDGMVYFGAGTKWRIMENHYWLPFLSWLPKYLANPYLKYVTDGKFEKYYENLEGYFKLKKIVRMFRINDYTTKIIKEYEKFHASDSMNFIRKICAKIPAPLLNLFKPLSTDHIWILTKNEKI